MMDRSFQLTTWPWWQHNSNALTDHMEVDVLAYVLSNSVKTIPGIVLFNI